MNNLRHRRHNECVVIRSTREKDSYWQCGLWTRGLNNATRYISVEEATQVTLYRNIRDCEVVDLNRI